MKFSGKKGQGAMEYLMTYGWAIMVVMIVGVVLWQMGVFNLGGSRTTATGFEKIKPLNPGDIIVSSAGNNVSIVFTNVAGGTITIESANVTFSAPSGVSCTTAYVTPMGGTTIGPLAPGTTATISQAGTFQLDVTCGGVTLTSGASYVADVNIVYTIEVGGFTRRYVETGTIRGKIT